MRLLICIGLMIFMNGSLYAATKHAVEVSSATAARQYLVTSEIYFGDKLISAPKVSVLENNKVTLGQESKGSKLDFSMILNAVDAQDPKSVRVSTEFFHLHEGKKIALKTQVVVLVDSGQETVVFGGSDSGSKNQSDYKLLIKVDRL